MCVPARPPTCPHARSRAHARPADFVALTVAVQRLASGEEAFTAPVVNLPTDTEELEDADNEEQVAAILSERLQANFWGVVLVSSTLGLFFALFGLAYNIDVAVETEPSVPFWKQRAEKSRLWATGAALLAKSSATSWIVRLPGENITVRRGDARACAAASASASPPARATPTRALVDRPRLRPFPTPTLPASDRPHRPSSG